MVTERAEDLLLVGENIALDLANTFNGPRDGAPEQEFLNTPEDLAAWAVHAGVVDERLPLDARELAQALELRAAVYAVFRAIAEGREPAAEQLAVLARQYAEAVARARLVPAYELVWDGEVVGPLAVAAVELLRHGPLDRVKLCDGCPWLFLDSSRNHSRRWCSMNECGSRIKVRRYRARRRATEG